ncbi:hypothetical protein P879_02703 [Paragonimus westermani]|uniref:U6 snRNA-associated Sm-like protein LSm6 n=1 Tax=Paragonimus westermani TaxID=34504 RepID=A0A8T0DFW3_9TREM|nr:hypothetical protein P879_02703 [Paragonimus westermani]
MVYGHLRPPPTMGESLGSRTDHLDRRPQWVVSVMTHKQTPRDFLKLIIGRPVVVKLNSGADYRGVLISLDGYMNVVLEQTEEYVDGQLKNKYGDTFIRGNNVFYISTQKRW